MSPQLQVFIVRTSNGQFHLWSGFRRVAIKADFEKAEQRAIELLERAVKQCA